MQRAKEIIEFFNKKRERQNFLIGEISSLNDEVKNLEKEKLSNIEKKNSFENIVVASKLILEKLVYVSKENIEKFLTYSLKQIFTDRDYSVEFIVREDSKRPSLELTLIENGINQEITDAVGGGILSVIGLLLQIYYLEVYELNKVMFIDEGLKEVSTGNTSSSDFTVNYLYNTLNYLKYLSENYGYKFIIVTHDNNVRDIADRVYEVKEGGVQLCQ